MIEWTQAKPPIENISHYDHVTCETPLGQIIIEWKSWKQDPSYDAMISRVEYIGTEYSLEDAKEKVKQYLIEKKNQLTLLLKEE